MVNTGKELVARGIHDLSNREGQEMISVNCAFREPYRIRAGRERCITGATATRTGLVEAANGGTLFLDEIENFLLKLRPDCFSFGKRNSKGWFGAIKKG